MYDKAGTLLLASRMKRLGDRLFSEITKAYRSLGVPFEPSWFPVFFLLDRDQSHSISSMAREMGVTDSAVSQLIRQLKERDLLGVINDRDDKRAGTICLSRKGQKLLQQVKPVWKAVEISIEEALSSGRHGVSLLSAMEALEDSINTTDLAVQIKSKADFIRLAENHTITTDLPLHEDWLRNIVLTYTATPHPNWPQSSGILTLPPGRKNDLTEHYILLDNKRPIALLITSILNAHKKRERILFCASAGQPSAFVEDFFILQLAKSRSHTVEVSAHINDRRLLYRLQKIGFGLKGFQEDPAVEYLDLIFNPSKMTGVYGHE